jgi:hypothetical protein
MTIGRADFAIVVAEDIMSFRDPPITGVPEPSTWLLLLSGLLIIAFRSSTPSRCAAR